MTPAREIPSGPAGTPAEGPPDALIGGVSRDGGLLVRAAATTRLCEEARRRHASAPTATAALGRALTAALLLGSLLKDRQSILLQWRGGGPLGAVVAEGRADLRVRGYVASAQAQVPSREGKLDVGRGVGRGGDLVVVKDLGLREPYVSSVALQSGELGDDLAYYLLTSEQIPSAVGLGVHVASDYRVAAAGGVLVQALPGADQAVVDRAVWNLGELQSVSGVLLAGAGPEEIASRVLAGIPFRTRSLGSPVFHCPCGPDRLAATLAALGPGEAEALLAERGEIRIRCGFCAQEWRRLTLQGEWQRAPASPP